MASSSKKRTTMAKMNRERAVQEKRVRKAEKKEERKLAAAEAARALEAGEIPFDPEAGEHDPEAVDVDEPGATAEAEETR